MQAESPQQQPDAFDQQVQQVSNPQDNFGTADYGPPEVDLLESYAAEVNNLYSHFTQTTVQYYSVQSS